MSDDSLPRAIQAFVGDSVPTAHLRALSGHILTRTAPTGHLRVQPGISEPGASVPTGHLPSTVPSPGPASSDSGEKK